MLNQGIIRHSTSPWSAPIWVVPKKVDSYGQRKWRVVVDYRNLNNKTVDDKYPLPNIEGLLCETLSRVLQTYFINSEINFIKCTSKLEDEITQTIQNFHEGKTNHRG